MCVGVCVYARSYMNVCLYVCVCLCTCLCEWVWVWVCVYMRPHPCEHMLLNCVQLSSTVSIWGKVV